MLNKIVDVADEVCEECPQAWGGECRAFLLPHSKEEREHRLTGGPKCSPSGGSSKSFVMLSTRRLILSGEGKLD